MTSRKSVTRLSGSERFPAFFQHFLAFSVFNSKTTPVTPIFVYHRIVVDMLKYNFLPSLTKNCGEGPELLQFFRNIWIRSQQLFLIQRAARRKVRSARLGSKGWWEGGSLPLSLSPCPSHPSPPPRAVPRAVWRRLGTSQTSRKSF